MPFNEVAVFQGPHKTIGVTIAASGTASSVIDCRGMFATHVVMPAEFTGTALKPQGSVDGAAFADIYDDEGNLVTLTVAAARIYTLPYRVYGLSYLRFAVDAQDAARALTVVMN